MEIPLNMQATIIRRSLAAGGIGIPGAFGAHLDVAPIAVVWTEMLVRLAGQARREMDKAKAAKIVAGVLAGIGIFKVGFKAANTYFAYTGIGTVPAVLANVGVNGVATYLFGRACAQLFLSSRPLDSAESIAMSILGLIGGALGLPLDGSGGSA